MIKLIAFCWLSFFCTLAFGQNNYTIKGTINDYQGKIQLEYDGIVKSTEVEGGRFSFTGEVMLPTEAVIRIPSKINRSFATFLIENDTLTLKINTVPHQILGGSSLGVTASVTAGGVVNESIRSFQKKADFQQMLSSTLHTRIYSMICRISRLAESNPKDIASIYYVVKYLPGFRKDSLVKIYGRLSDHLKSNAYGRAINERIDQLSKGIYSEKFTDFNIWSFTERSFFDSRSLRGRFSLIEFCSSDSLLQSKEHSSLSELYSRYLPKGFEIVSICFNPEGPNKRYTSMDDRLKWPVFLIYDTSEYQQLQGYRNSNHSNNYLLDPNGKIIASDLNAKQLEQKLAELIK